MDLLPPTPIDIVLPVHNEGAAIGGVLEEFYSIVARDNSQPIRFIVCEDGSTDNTVDVVQALARDLPIVLLSATVRKGYAKAVIDGLRRAESTVVGFIDSDGQCEPRDFPRFLAAIERADLVLGYRNPRADHWIRKGLSKAFGLVYRRLFPVALRDPSCPYLLIRRPALDRILAGNVGVLPQGFWWEFVARASALRLEIIEVPTTHRRRLAGTTQVYRPTRLPRIAMRHIRGLFLLRRELRHASSTRAAF